MVGWAASAAIGAAVRAASTNDLISEPLAVPASDEAKAAASSTSAP
jgi:hypothetical protein